MKCLLGDTPVRFELDYDKYDNSSYIEPSQFSLSYGMSQYGQAEFKFNRDTAQKLYSSDEHWWTGHPDKVDYGNTVSMYVDDTKVKTFYMPNDTFELGLSDADYNYDTAGSCKLYDAHMLLDRGVVNYAPRTTTLQETYRNIFNSIDVNDSLLTSMSINAEKNPTFYNDDGGFRIGGNVRKDGHFDVKYSWALNFDEITPLKAIERANEIFGVTSYMKPVDGGGVELIIGEHVADERRMTASETEPINDFHIKSASLSDNYTSVGQVNIMGPKVTPAFAGNLGLDDFVDALTNDDLIEGEDVQSEYKYGYRIRAEISNKNAPNGKTVTIQAHNLEPEELVPAGLRAFKKLEISESTGYITVSYPTSNTEKVPSLGDEIYVSEAKPPCDNMPSRSYPGGRYFVKAVNLNQNKTLEGEFDLMSVPDAVEISTGITYINIENPDEKLTHKEIYGITYENSALNPANSDDITD
jgi:hypothetical protein